MTYRFKAHPTRYAGVLFRSRLEARWAAFLDLIGWRWEYEPVDLNGWSPDFRVHVPCGRGDCCESHQLLAEVKPYNSLAMFDGHPCRRHAYGDGLDGTGAHASAAFGDSPDVTWFEMAHGCGGGVYGLPYFVDGGASRAAAAWKQAGNVVQYRPQTA